MVSTCLYRICIRKINTREQLAVSHNSKNTITLETLAENVDTKMTEGMQEIWIIPEKIAINKQIGQGICFDGVFICCLCISMVVKEI